VVVDKDFIARAESEEWLTGPKEDGYYWVIRGDAEYGLEIVSVNTDDKGNRNVFFMGDEEDTSLVTFCRVEVWFLPIPEPAAYPWHGDLHDGCGDD